MSATRGIMLLIGLWAGCFAAAFVLSYWAEPTGEGFTRGWNRVGIWLGWQTAALAVAIVTLIVTRRAGDAIGESLRRYGQFPALVSGLTSLGMMGVVGWLIYAA